MAPSVLPQQLQQQSVSGTSSYAGGLQQLSEHVPELLWPNSTFVYDRMRKDGQVSGVLRAVTLPPRGTAWHVIDAPDVRPEVATFVRNNLGLVEEGDTRMRRKNQGISWDHLLRHAFLNLPFGHMFFEPVFELGPPGPNDTLPPGTYAHLARMAPIMPQTLGAFNIDRTGDLVSITQTATDERGKTIEILLPRELILPVINDREGGDWTGQSILRGAYKDWFLKGELERLAVQIVERNGMGVPVGEFGPDGDRIALQRALSNIRAGDQAGGAFPEGSNVRLLGVTGQTVDPLPLILQHQQAISRSMLAMFLDMGHDNGARSLGETFVDFFTMVENAVIADLEETFTEGLSRLLVSLNFGPDEAYPEILADKITPQAPLTAETIATLVTAGVIHPDAALEEATRSIFGMPPASPTDADQPPPEIPDDTIAVQVGGGTSHASGRRWSRQTALTLDQRESLLERMRTRIGPRRR